MALGLALASVVACTSSSSNGHGEPVETDPSEMSESEVDVSTAVEESLSLSSGRLTVELVFSQGGSTAGDSGSYVLIETGTGIFDGDDTELTIAAHEGTVESTESISHGTPGLSSAGESEMRSVDDTTFTRAVDGDGSSGPQPTDYVKWESSHGAGFPGSAVDLYRLIFGGSIPDTLLRLSHTSDWSGPLPNQNTDSLEYRGRLDVESVASALHDPYLLALAKSAVVEVHAWLDASGLITRVSFDAQVDPVPVACDEVEGATAEEVTLEETIDFVEYSPQEISKPASGDVVQGETTIGETDDETGWCIPEQPPI